ncbi:MAG: two-component sensor histidine kinase, partial [Lachnospiraceae bacterium]|nr:two-component sensor histidine kinase [Lachnospiraceae bacterium]
YVWADEFMIEGVITNYISNALNHIVPPNQIRITLEQRENVIRLKVFNSGEHIPEEDLGHIWEKFYKVDKARTREYGGSGIGLSIVAATMEAHKKAYGVENVEGGVEFFIELDSQIES